ncbi:DUF397 domain-containing protein [Streptomyces sp. NBC_00343]|uniref:DUF397 domain-containing protein n=1 Tax=Streptomyces sp. NBC_00343 TaxID=2975719 RepID=UPI002E2C9AC2|nr:DUF397 domain-containing protein [Streptomyces sp. NBC_00343]
MVWFTSSYSNGAGGECVKCAMAEERALVRDSKSGTGPVITVSRGAWCAFLVVLKHGRSTH